jgi:hypothetical protein
MRIASSARITAKTQPIQKKTPAFANPSNRKSRNRRTYHRAPLKIEEFSAIAFGNLLSPPSPQKTPAVSAHQTHSRFRPRKLS